MIRAYCINLDHRTDRWSQAQANYAAQGLGGGAVQRWPAVADPEFGELGCAKSHLAVLTHFLTQTDDKFCVMLEDDFRFLRPFAELTGAIVDLSRQGVAWDVLLLSGTDVVPYPESPPGLARVAESSTTAGYLVSRTYAHKLIACFAECVTLLEPYRPLRPRQSYTLRLAVDQAWKRLQGVDRWLIFTQAFGHQQPSFSDIVQRNTDYSHVAFGVARAAST